MQTNLLILNLHHAIFDSSDKHGRNDEHEHSVYQSINS